jgi:hypothetical protein
MVNRPGTPLFLERRSYRFRRMMDAVRLLPLLVLALWMVPLLWPVGDVADAESVPMSHAVRYIFGVWLGAIALAFLLWRRTAGQIARENQD